MKFVFVLLTIAMFCWSSEGHAAANSCSQLFDETPHFSEQKQFYSQKEIKEDFETYLKQNHPSEVQELRAVAKTNPSLVGRLVKQSKIVQSTGHAIGKMLSVIKNYKLFQLIARADHTKVTKEEYYQQMLVFSRKLFEAKLSRMAEPKSAIHLPMAPEKKVDLMIETLISHLHMNEEISLNAIFSGINEFNPQIYRRSQFTMLLKSVMTQNLNKFHLLELLQRDVNLQQLIESNNYDGLRVYLKKRLQPVAYADWLVSSSSTLLNVSMLYLEMSITYTVMYGQDLTNFLPAFNIHLAKAAQGEGSNSVWNFTSMLNYYSDLNQYSKGPDLTGVEQQYFNELRASGALTPFGQ